MVSGDGSVGDITGGMRRREYALETSDNTDGKQIISGGPRSWEPAARLINNQLKSSWGGARNSAGRTSDSLSLNQAVGIIEAAQFAAAIGLPLNRHVTIHWELAGIPDCQAAGATGRFLKLVGDWIAKVGGRIAWAWVRENEGRSGSRGSHVHILLHVPAGPQWSGWRLRRWLERITGKPYRAGAVQTQRIGATVRAAATAPAAYDANLASVVGYILKGAAPDAAKALGLERIEAGGRIVGKRAATSQNIGWAARTRSLK